MYREYKPQKFSLVVLASTALLFTSAAVYMLLSHRQPVTVFYFSLGLGIFMIIITIRATKRRIIIANDSISYFKSFKGLRLKYIHIVKIQTTAKVSGVSHHGVHTKRTLSLFTNSGSLDIDIKPYSGKSLKEIAIELVKNCPTADIDQSTRAMCEGKMPSVFKNITSQFTSG
jgi:hypothetical protein